MTATRALSALRLWVLAWFMASLGVAVASPLIHPQSFEVICSGSGAIKLLVQTDEGPVEMGAMGMDCPLCAHHSAPPPVPAATVLPPPPAGACAAAGGSRPHRGGHSGTLTRTRPPRTLLS